MALAVAAIDEGSLAAAARRHGCSAAAATRAVAMLEHAAGETLLLRSTRGLRPTEAGERHAVVWRDVLARLAELRGTTATDALSGTLVLTAPELFGRLKVVPVLERFLDRHPGMRARALLLNRIVDMVGEGIDVAIRLAPLSPSSLVAVTLGAVQDVVCASPAYLARAAPPTSPVDLARHACIGTVGEGNRELWTFRHPDPRQDRHPDRQPGRTRSVQVHTRMASTSVASGIESALRGHGLVRCRSYQVAELLAAGHLRRVLRDHEPDAIPVSILFRPTPRRNSPVRSFIDHAVPVLRRELQQVADTLDRLPAP